MAHQVIGRCIRIVYEVNDGVTDLGQVVGRATGGHTHGDAVGTVDQQIGNGRRQYNRFFLAPVVVFGHINGLLFNIREHERGNGFHS